MSNQEVVRRIAQVDKPHAETMENNPVTFRWQALPFYRRFKLLIADVNLRHRPLQFRYADDGAELYILGATPDHIYKVNQREALHLGLSDVSGYVRFFYENISGADITVVEKPDDLHWLQSAQTEAAPRGKKQVAENLIHPIRVVQDAAGYTVVATALRSDELVELSLSIAPSGRVDVKNQKALVEKLPVPQVFH